MIKTSSTVFVFASPQYLADNKDIRDALLQCQRRRTLRAVAIDLSFNIVGDAKVAIITNERRGRKAVAVLSIIGGK